MDVFMINSEKLLTPQISPFRDCRILITTDVSGMGTDVADLNLVINLGIPKTPWKFLQQCGRAGRENQPSAAITVKFPQKGDRC